MVKPSDSMKVTLCLFIAMLVDTTYAGESMTNLEVIKSTYEGKNSKEKEKNLKKYVADNIRWTEIAGFPYAGSYTGFQAVSGHVFQRLSDEWIDYNFVVDDYVANNNKVVAYGTYSGTYKATNKYFEARVAHLWALENKR